MEPLKLGQAAGLSVIRETSMYPLKRIYNGVLCMFVHIEGEADHGLQGLIKLG